MSLTEPLRTAMGQGITVYFTYDPHWSEQGHAVVARHLAARLRTVGDYADCHPRGRLAT